MVCLRDREATENSRSRKNCIFFSKYSSLNYPMWEKEDQVYVFFAVLFNRATLKQTVIHGTYRISKVVSLMHADQSITVCLSSRLRTRRHPNEPQVLAAHHYTASVISR